jgi:hypothetical protein
MRGLQENLRVEREANEAYEHHRATAVTTDGRRFGARPNPYVAPELPPGKINVTDLDSRNVKTPRSYTQGYNVQAVVNEHQIVLAAEVTLSSPDFGQLEPMVKATQRELQQIDVSDTPEVAVADSGYWHEEQIDQGREHGHPGPDPARCRQARHAPPRLGWRALRLHAHRARWRARRRALPKTQDDSRAGVHSNQAQPAHQSVPATREIRRTLEW